MSWEDNTTVRMDTTSSRTTAADLPSWQDDRTRYTDEMTTMMTTMTTMSAMADTEDWITRNMTTLDVTLQQNELLFQPYLPIHRTIVEYVVIVGIVLFGLIGNLLIIILLIKHSTLRKQATNILILNQSVIDFLSAFVLSGLCFTKMMLDYGFLKVQLIDGTLSGNIWCTWIVNNGLLRPLFFTSSLGLIGITIERYFGIWH